MTRQSVLREFGAPAESRSNVAMAAEIVRLRDALFDQREANDMATVELREYRARERGLLMALAALGEDEA